MEPRLQTVEVETNYEFWISWLWRTSYIWGIIHILELTSWGCSARPALILAGDDRPHPRSLFSHPAASLWGTVKSRRATRVNSFITRRSFHVATSGPKVPPRPCSPISSANASTAPLCKCWPRTGTILGNAFSRNLWKMGDGGISLPNILVSGLPVPNLIQGHCTEKSREGSKDLILG